MYSLPLPERNGGMNSNTPMKEQLHYNQWKAMFAVSRASLRSMLRSPSAVIFSVAFPLIFIVVFGFIRSNDIRLDVAIHQESDTTSHFFRQLKRIGNVRLSVAKDDQAQLDLLHKGRLDAIIRIEATESGHERITVLTSKASREKGRFVETLVDNLANSRNKVLLDSLLQNATAQSVHAMRELPPVTDIVREDVPGREYKMIDFILPGQLGFSILSAGVFGTAFVFFSLRQTLVLKRFFATPIRRIYIVLGEAISRLIFQLAGATVIILLGKFLFGFTLINGWITAAQMLLLSAMGLIVFMGFGFVISGIASSESTIPPIANIITLPQFLLSGTFFPVDAFPNWLQAISNLLPLTYLNDALRKVAFEGAGFYEIWPQLSVISLWGLFVYLLAVRFFRWE